MSNEMEKIEFEHPLDWQNAIEREIQLQGAKNPDHFVMPDGRTLTEVRKSLDDQHRKEFKNETRMIGKTTRDSSLPGLTKGEKWHLNETGQILDTTEAPESKETVTLATSRTSLSDPDDDE